MGKSVFFWTTQRFGCWHGVGWVGWGGGGFATPIAKNMDNGILNANGNFGTDEKWHVLRTISIQVDDLFISESIEFAEYIS